MKKLERYKGKTPISWLADLVKKEVPDATFFYNPMTPHQQEMFFVNKNGSYYMVELSVGRGGEDYAVAIWSVDAERHTDYAFREYPINYHRRYSVIEKWYKS